MRHEYVQKLQGRYESRIKLLQNQPLELRKYDERLHYFTGQRIALDLDDGVKVNYGKFGTLLANVKDVTGK